MAGYGVVSALFPRAQAPMALLAPQPQATPDTGVSHAAVAPAPAAPYEIQVEPLTTAPLVTASAPAVEPASAADPAAPQAATGDIVIASMSQPAIELPSAPDLTQQAPDLAALAPTPANAAPASTDLAMLASADATARTGATLDFATTRPAPRPDTETLAVADAEEMSRIRPQPRPAGLVLAAATPADAIDAVVAAVAVNDIPGIRPQPRPEVIRVASATPRVETTAAEPAPRRSGGLFGGTSTCGPKLAKNMPGRRSGASAGTQFFAALGNASGSERDNLVINELARGNMPNFLRDLQPVVFRGKDAKGADAEIVICVTPDYLALGSDSDYVRVPLGLPAAARIAGRFDMTLPTPRMVDAIYAQADVHLSPAPMQAGPQMSSTAYLLRHNATIQGQLKGRHGLIAGQKKDVVMASRMANHPGRVAIYGWHRSATSPIQPVSTVHQASYRDYSHGIRLVSRTAFLNGKAVDIDDLLGSGRYAYLLNKEGPLPGPVIRIASR